MSSEVLETTPTYSLHSLDDGAQEKIQLRVQLPGVESARDLQVHVQGNRLLLRVPGRYKLDLPLNRRVAEKPLMLRFVKKKAVLKAEFLVRDDAINGSAGGGAGANGHAASASGTPAVQLRRQAAAAPHQQEQQQERAPPAEEQQAQAPPPQAAPPPQQQSKAGERGAKQQLHSSFLEEAMRLRNKAPHSTSSRAAAVRGYKGRGQHTSDQQQESRGATVGATPAAATAAADDVGGSSGSETPSHSDSDAEADAAQAAAASAREQQQRGKPAAAMAGAGNSGNSAVPGGLRRGFFAPRPGAAAAPGGATSAASAPAKAAPTAAATAAVRKGEEPGAPEWQPPASPDTPTLQEAMPAAAAAAAAAAVFPQEKSGGGGGSGGGTQPGGAPAGQRAQQQPRPSSAAGASARGLANGAGSGSASGVEWAVHEEAREEAEARLREEARLGANRQAAAEWAERASQAEAAGDLDRAVKLLTKAQNLSPAEGYGLRRAELEQRQQQQSHSRQDAGASPHQQQQRQQTQAAAGNASATPPPKQQRPQQRSSPAGKASSQPRHQQQHRQGKSSPNCKSEEAMPRQPPNQQQQQQGRDGQDKEQPRGADSSRAGPGWASSVASAAGRAAATAGRAAASRAASAAQWVAGVVGPAGSYAWDAADGWAPAAAAKANASKAAASAAPWLRLAWTLLLALLGAAAITSVALVGKLREWLWLWLPAHTAYFLAQCRWLRPATWLVSSGWGGTAARSTLLGLVAGVTCLVAPPTWWVLRWLLSPSWLLAAGETAGAAFFGQQRPLLALFRFYPAMWWASGGGWWAASGSICCFFMMLYAGGSMEPGIVAWIVARACMHWMPWWLAAFVVLVIAVIFLVGCVPSEYSSQRAGEDGGQHYDSAEMEGLGPAPIPKGATGEIARVLSALEFYSVLQVERTASETELKRAFRARALLTHPDKVSGAVGADEAFRRVQQAHEVLSNASSRSEYDTRLAQHEAQQQRRRPSPPPSPSSSGHHGNGAGGRSWAHHQQEAAVGLTISCENCGRSHDAPLTSRDARAARYCNVCGIHHAADDGDGWVEDAGMWLFPSRRMYVCSGGHVYDATRWATCSGVINHMEPNSHAVGVSFAFGGGGSHAAAAGGGGGPGASRGARGGAKGGPRRKGKKGRR